MTTFEQLVQITELMFQIETAYGQGFAEISETHRAVEDAVTRAYDVHNGKRLEFYRLLLERSLTTA